MGNETLVKLANVIRRERDALLARWRAEVRSLPSAKHLDTPTLNDHVPALLEELAAAFQSPSDKTIADTVLEGSPPAHGLQRYEEGFDIIEVVAEYNVLRGCIYELAENVGVGLRPGFSHPEPCFRRRHWIGRPGVRDPASARSAAPP